jgi:hypothetical protein
MPLTLEEREMLVWIVLAVIALLVVSWKLYDPSITRELEHVKRGGAVEGLQAALSRLSDRAQPSGFNRAIRVLWDAYQREKAIPLIKELARRHPESRISQYWIEQVRSVEPQLASVFFDQKFLETCYQPELAASCGPVG